MKVTCPAIISIKPYWANLIITGHKTVELRRFFPSYFHGNLFIYSSSPTKAVIAVAQVDKVLRLPIEDIWFNFQIEAQISRRFLYDYFVFKTHGYVLQIENIRSYKIPIPLAELNFEHSFTAPQNFQYVRPALNAYLLRRLQNDNIHG